MLSSKFVWNYNWLITPNPPTPNSLHICSSSQQSHSSELLSFIVQPKSLLRWVFSIAYVVILLLSWQRCCFCVCYCIGAVQTLLCSIDISLRACFTACPNISNTAFNRDLDQPLLEGPRPIYKHLGRLKAIMRICGTAVLNSCAGLQRRLFEKNVVTETDAMWRLKAPSCPKSIHVW